MSTISFLENNLICAAGSSNDTLYLIVSGKVVVSAPGVKINLEKGDMIGCCELGYDLHFLSYMAMEDVTVMEYSALEEDLENLISSNADFSAILLRSLTGQLEKLMAGFLAAKKDAADLFSVVTKGYARYEKLCSMTGSRPQMLGNLSLAKEYTDDTDLSNRLMGYYHQIYQLCGSSRGLSSDFLLCLMAKSGKDARNIVLGSKKAFLYLVQIGKLLLSDEGTDLLDIYEELFFQIYDNKELQTQVGEALQFYLDFANHKPYLDVNLYLQRVADLSRRKETRNMNMAAVSEGNVAEALGELTGSMEHILEYSRMDESFCQEMRDLVKAYKGVSDKLSSEDNIRLLRRDLTSFFFKLYENVFYHALEDFTLPKVVRMFLDYGYLDEELAGIENAMVLSELADEVTTDPERGVYSFSQWLSAIYNGQKLPSKNEFDVDYESFVHEQKVKNQITAKDEEELMKDRRRMVEYELHNVFQTADKVTYGHITTFCPIFKAEDAQRRLRDTQVTAELCCGMLNSIREKDYSLFYRETVYSSKKYDVDREYIDVEVLPDIILMPNAGSRGIMWQEIQGRVRTTPARMFLPAFQNEDLNLILLRMCAEYRWEMCKRVQGARWNDVTDPSLTSAYFDYAQFYRKNHDLSAEAKEKVKLQQQRAKNSFKEMFILDYLLWMMYEANGSPRLNKVVRSILATYVPFTSRIRNALALNPTFKEYMERFEIHQNQKIHRMNNLIIKLQKSKGVPKEIEQQDRFLRM